MQLQQRHPQHRADYYWFRKPVLDSSPDALAATVRSVSGAPTSLALERSLHSPATQPLLRIPSTGRRPPDSPGIKNEGKKTEATQANKLKPPVYIIHQLP